MPIQPFPRVSPATTLLLAAACGPSDDPARNVTQLRPVLAPQTSEVDVLLQAVSVVNERIVWVSGHEATYGRTTDGGATWTMAQVPGPDTLQFRDVHAVDESTAYLLAAGPGEMSRIYRTRDGGSSWTLQFLNDEPDAFYDCFDFWDADHGLAYGDAVNGEMRILRTEDGATWTRLDPATLPEPRGSEGGFAASGTCLATTGERDAWIATGAGDTARVLRTTDRGDTWTTSLVPVVSGSGSSGLTSIVLLDSRRGVALGGDIGTPDEPGANVAVTADAAASWTSGGRNTFTGAVYGAAAVPGADGTLIAVGPNGLDYSTDMGGSWMALDTLSYWAVGVAGPSAGWAVGPAGRIAKVAFVPLDDPSGRGR